MSMDDDAWSFGLSEATPWRSGNYLCLDYEEVDGNDDLKAELVCPFCAEDFDLIALCCHIDDEHPGARFGVCPLCDMLVEKNLVRHIRMHYRDIFKGRSRLKPHRSGSSSTFSFSEKDFCDEKFESLVEGLTPMVSTSRTAPDPLLSFISYEPVADYKNEQLDSPPETIVEEKSSDDTLLERDNSCPEQHIDISEKTQRCNFVQELLFSAVLDDML